MHQKIEWQLHQLKKLHASGDFVPKTPTKLYSTSAKDNIFYHPIFTNDFFFMNLNKYARPQTMLLFILNICFKYAPKWMVSTWNFHV